MKKIVSFLLSVALLVSSSGIAVVFAEEKAYTNYDIIMEIANAYDRQGAQSPYDQYNARRSIYSSPEDATAQRTIFHDCSSFVNSCYREAFGVNVMPYEIGETGTSPSTANIDSYAKNNPDAVDVVGYWEPANYTDVEKKNVVDFIYNNIQIGDVIVYRHGVASGTKGHAIMYAGNNTFIHCAGAGSYVMDRSNPAMSYDSGLGEIKSEGTIGMLDAADVFENTKSSRYIFKATESDTIWSFCIIRPMARGLTPTEETINRMKIAGLSMEKTSSVCENASVDTDDILTYTVTLENTNEYTLSGVTITDTLPDGTEFVSGDKDVTVIGNSLTWKGDVGAKTTLNINYSVKITADIPGALITSNATYVSGVKLGNISHSVSGYSKTQRALIGGAALRYVQKEQSFENGFEMVKELYKSTLNVELFDYTTPESVLDQLIDTDNRTRHFSTELSKMIAPNLYGGYNIRYGWLYLESENDKTRLPKEEHLSVGDIILADWEGGNTVFVYVGNKTLVTVEEGKCKAVTIGDNIYTPGENILISLLAYDRYAVVRPTMSSAVPEMDISSIEIESLPEKLSYYSGEKFDSSKMVVNAILSNGQSVEIANYTVSPETLVYPAKSVDVVYGELRETIDVEVNQEEKITIIVNGTELKTDINPKLVNGRTLVPMNAIFESLDINVEWDPATKTATAKNEERELCVTMDSHIAKIDGKEVLMDVSPTIYKETILVPVRFIAESFSADVDWIDDKRCVVVTGGKVLYPSVHNIDGAIGFYNVVQSADDGDGQTIYKALDGDASSYWAVSRDDVNGAYGIFDFGFSKDIKSVLISFLKGAQRVYAFDILTSDDGINFTSVAENLQSSGTSAELEEFEVNASGRYVKIVGHGHKDGVWNSYSEIVFTEKK